jgi:hypothetical protein
MEFWLTFCCHVYIHQQLHKSQLARIWKGVLWVGTVGMQIHFPAFRALESCIQKQHRFCTQFLFTLDKGDQTSRF